MRAEIGKLTLDQTFEERDKINEKILFSLTNSTEDWGLNCLRYEIKDIRVSDTIKKVMNLEADSERKKRAEILMSEGKKTS
jgi:regulator of protease activity HflC (stomatin/prohibitin superfamily)